MNDTLVFENYQPQNIIIDGGGSVIGLTAVLVNGVDVTEGSVAYVVVPTKVSELENDSGYLTAETDPTVPYYVKRITMNDINNWNSKQDLLVSGTNIKTINNNSVLGSGNIEITETPYTAGTGIEINNHEINNTITSYNDLTDLPTIPTKTSDLTNDSDYVVSSSLSNVAFSGSYLDLEDQPLIPQATSELENDSGFITKEVNNLDNYMLKQYLDLILPKVSGSGTSITLDDTVGAELNPILSGNTSQETTSISGGDEYDSPSPDHPQPIHSVTGDNSINVEGKNLFNINKLITGGTYEYYQFKDTSSDDLYTLSIKLKDGGTSKNMYIGFATNYSVPLQNNTWLLENGTMRGTTQSDGFNSLVNNSYSTKQSYIVVYKGSGNTLQDLFNNYDIQLVKGDTYQPYESYSGNTYPLTLGTLELNKIGDYEDIFIKATNETGLESGKWYLKKNIGKVVLNGNETWNYNGGSVENNASSFTTILENSKNVENSSNENLILTNYFKGLSPSSTISLWVLNSISLISNNRAYLTLDRTEFSTDADLVKNWLSTHNTIVYYVLTTPTYTLLNDTLQTQLDNIWNMKSKVNQTNISQVNDDLPMVISVSTFKVIGG